MTNVHISVNNLQTEFSGSRLIKIFNKPKVRERIISTKKRIRYSKSDILQKILDFLSNEDWSHAGNKTSFNTIQLLNKYNVIKRFYSKDSAKKHKAYLKLVNDNKFYIRNQDQFHYALVSELYELFKNQGRYDIINDMFYYNDELVFVNEDKITIEETEKTSSGSLRTDMAFYVNKYKIIVEYLENHHDRDKLLGHEFDRVRALRLLGDTNNQSYNNAHIAFFWEKNLYSNNKYTFKSNNFSNFVKHIGRVILDYYLISDEDAYCINKLTQITDNQSLSKQIYLAHNNQNKPVIDLQILEKLFKWVKQTKSKIKTEKIWYDEFINRIKLIQTEILAEKNKHLKNMSVFDSDEEDDDKEINNSTNIPDDKLVYYEIKDDTVYLTHFGLHLYIDIEPKYLADMYEYFKIKKFYNDITSGLINAIKEVRLLKENYQKNQIYGL